MTRVWDQFFSLSHIAKRWLWIQCYIFLFVICLETPKAGSSQTGEQFPPLWAHRQFHFYVSQNVRTPRTVLLNGGWKCRSMSFGTVVPTGRLFWQPEEISKSPGIRIDTNVFPSCIIYLNFINRGQDSMYLGLEHCSVFYWTDTESSSQILPIVSGPGSLQHPGPSVYQAESQVLWSTLLYSTMLPYTWV